MSDGGAEATPSPADLAAEDARLGRALRRAEAERDIPKKAALIFGGAGRRPSGPPMSIAARGR